MNHSADIVLKSDAADFYTMSSNKLAGVIFITYLQCWVIFSAIPADSIYFLKSYFFEAESGIFLLLFNGLKTLPLVLA